MNDIGRPKWLGVALFGLATLFALVFMLAQVWRLSEALDTAAQKPFAVAEALMKIRSHAFLAQASLEAASSTVDPAEMATLIGEEDNHIHDMRQWLAVIARSEDQPEVYTPLLATLNHQAELHREVKTMLGQGLDHDAHALLMTEGTALLTRLDDVLDDILARERQLANTLYDQSRRAEYMAEIASILLALTVGGTLALAVSGGILLLRTYRPLMKLRHALMALADGRTDVEVPYQDRAGWVGNMARTVAHLRRHLADRDAARNAQSLSESRLGVALSVAPVVLYHLDENLCFTQIHNGQLPIPDEAFLGRTSAHIFDDDTQAQLDTLYAKVMSSGESRRQQVVIRLRGLAEVEHFDIFVAPLRDNKGRIAGLTCAAIKITEQVVARQALEKAAREAQRANEAKARFLAAASHDLRQPMQALRLFLDCLNPRLTHPTDRAIIDGALTALSAGEQLLGNYKHVAVLEAGLLTPEVERTPLAPILTGLVREFADRASDKGLELRLVPCNAEVETDPKLLRRLLRNLLANAVTFTPAGRVLLGCRRQGDKMRIDVWDTGVGIPADCLSAVFEDFFQMGNPERDRAKGLGLGLSVVERTARLLGHEVAVASIPGRGSVFSVTVPLAPPKKPDSVGELQAA